jgi:hypothetical protein
MLLIQKSQKKIYDVVHETAHNKKEKLKLTQDFNYVLMHLQLTRAFRNMEDICY